VPPQSRIHRVKSCMSMLMMLRLWGTGHRRQGEQMQVSEIRCSLAQWNHVNHNYYKKHDPPAKRTIRGLKELCQQILIWYWETKGIPDFRQGWTHCISNSIRHLFVVVLIQVSIFTGHLDLEKTRSLDQRGQIVPGEGML
jgi:hypothetical protein